jgi:hypothetical protein
MGTLIALLICKVIYNQVEANFKRHSDEKVKLLFFKVMTPNILKIFKGNHMSDKSIHLEYIHVYISVYWIK